MNHQADAPEVRARYFFGVQALDDLIRLTSPDAKGTHLLTPFELVNAGGLVEALVLEDGLHLVLWPDFDSKSFENRSLPKQFLTEVQCQPIDVREFSTDFGISAEAETREVLAERHRISIEEVERRWDQWHENPWHSDFDIYEPGGEFAREFDRMFYGRLFFSSVARRTAVMTIPHFYGSCSYAVRQYSLSRKMYAAMEEEFRQQITEIIAVTRPLRVYIPPILAIALHRSCGNPGRLLNEIIALREEYRPVRIRAYEAELAMAAESDLHRQIGILQDLKGRLKRCEQP